jgi:FkbM family methyltransferase
MANFVTYAQNFEDLMLWRALRDVTEGFYIDVGAGDPDEDSVTRAFYDRGWHGINIEPSPDYFEALAAARPRDLTLQCLVGAASGEMTLHHFPGTGLSTTNVAFAGRHVTDGRESNTIRMPVLPLTEIWRCHAPQTVHFLKIDVEGAEAEVLLGADLRVFRPWIVVAEATEPGSRVENWSQWNDILIDANYEFCWFDGLNRYYVAAEHGAALKCAFATPPNVFDQWIQPRGKQQRALIDRAQETVISSLQAANAAHEAMRVANAEAAEAKTDLTAAQARIAVTDARLADMQAELQLQQGVMAEAAEAKTDLTAAQARIAVTDARLADMQAELQLQLRVMMELNRQIGSIQMEVARAKATLSERESQWREETVRFQSDLHSAQLAQADAEVALQAVHCSTSWRITAPLRRAVALARRLIRRLRSAGRGQGLLAANMGKRPYLPAGPEVTDVLPRQGTASSDPNPPISIEEQRVLVRLHVRSYAR